MTSTEYLARRDKILKAMAAPQEAHAGSAGVTNRSMRDLTLGLAALDADWARQNSTTTTSIGRMYSTEGL